MLVQKKVKISVYKWPFPQPFIKLSSICQLAPLLKLSLSARMALRRSGMEGGGLGRVLGLARRAAASVICVNEALRGDPVS